MHNDESVANYFLCIDEIVNCMKKLGEEIKEVSDPDLNRNAKNYNHKHRYAAEIIIHFINVKY